MKHPIQDMTCRAFTLVETLLMLCALAVFSLTSLAVLKKDEYSVKVILSKLNQPQNTKPADVPLPLATTPPPASASKMARAKVDMLASTLVLPPVVPSPAPSVPAPAPAPKSAPAGSPAPTPDNKSTAAPGTAN